MTRVMLRKEKRSPTMMDYIEELLDIVHDEYEDDIDDAVEM